MAARARAAPASRRDQLLLLPHILGMGLLRQTGLFHRLLQWRQLRRVLFLLLRQLGCLLLYRRQLGAAAIAFTAQRPQFLGRFAERQPLQLRGGLRL
ncbi:hypothetical protein, partial [Enterobacter hormaechei]|uniref:hypothetical protein n=1 Tax=Enterobacter hormaechei TaxID=158836 RepID=UPI003D039861